MWLAIHIIKCCLVDLEKQARKLGFQKFYLILLPWNNITVEVLRREQSQPGQEGTWSHAGLFWWEKKMNFLIGACTHSLVEKSDHCTCPSLFLIHAPALTLIGAWFHIQKSCQFDSRSGHIPRLDLVRVHMRSNQSMFLSHNNVPLSLFPHCIPALKSIKTYEDFKKLHGPPALDLKSSTPNFDLGSPLNWWPWTSYLTFTHGAIGFKWDSVYKVLLTLSQRSINSSCDDDDDWTWSPML